ncbi:RHS repeat-associated core domain-containing protein [Faecalispora jeddahensis]|uniref:RHS repeat-associated core domain-containing protein n=1 Tax=Faecalispora jeddahensis TaxID=1414721 RepID=UPI0004AC71BA|nr:RHS repeat-associated core domain-containing protein [Faecalispora jeddahensis]
MDFVYDTLNRISMTKLVHSQGNPALRTQTEFVPVSDYRTTTLTKKFINNRWVSDTDSSVLSQFQYTYDDNGNISTVTDAQNNVTTYTYDQLNQLVRTDDQKAGTSIAYSYDVGGNITAVSTYAYTTGELGSPTNTISYAYDNANWKDLLTSYNGQSITYDQIGNPLIYRDGMSFTWEGRQLRTAAVNGKGISYTYNNDGIRTGKTVDGVTTEYLVDGSNVLAQKTGNDVLWFLYDSDGTRVGFTYNDTAYYYTKNAQGDVTGIVDSSANTVVEYSYDAWGKLLTTTGSKADTIGKLNPFLYRGYYYDAETELYYLNSRYYDAQTGRFLNADAAIGQTGNVQGHNMFAYAFNNPVMYDDPSGNWPKLSTIFTVVAVAAAVVAVVAVCVATAGLASVAVAGGGTMLVATATTTAALGVAASAGKVALAATGAAAVSKAAEKTYKNLSKNHTVYGLQNTNTGRIEYVGRTTNPAKRAKAHEMNPARANLEMVTLATGLNAVEARGVEQILMLAHHTINTRNSMNNQINGISPFNPKLGMYMEAGRGALAYLDNQISNEVLYWTGN